MFHFICLLLEKLPILVMMQPSKAHAARGGRGGSPSEPKQFNGESTWCRTPLSLTSHGDLRARKQLVEGLQPAALAAAGRGAAAIAATAKWPAAAGNRCVPGVLPQAAAQAQQRPHLHRQLRQSLAAEQCTAQAAASRVLLSVGACACARAACASRCLVMGCSLAPNRWRSRRLPDGCAWAEAAAAAAAAAERKGGVVQQRRRQRQVGLLLRAQQPLQDARYVRIADRTLCRPALQAQIGCLAVLQYSSLRHHISQLNGVVEFHAFGHMRLVASQLRKDVTKHKCNVKLS